MKYKFFLGKFFKGNLLFATFLFSLNSKSQILFGAPSHYTLGFDGLPFSLTGGDFNKDGKIDIAACDYSNRSVTIFRGNGSGGFSMPSHFFIESGGGPLAVITGDFNSDSSLDLAIANSVLDSINILWGNGTGNFYLGASFAVADGPMSLVSADLNHDGASDIISANAGLGGYSVSLLINNGSGSFISGGSYSTSGSPHGIVSADFNNDGHSDIATANFSNSAISVFFGDGAGRLSPEKVYPAGNGANSIVCADFNKDGKFDLATGNAQNISILTNNGGGIFSVPANYSAGTFPYGLVSKDFDKDGHLDLAVVNVNSDNITILKGKRDGTFFFQQNIIVQRAPHGIVSADFNNDGKDDLVVSNAHSSSISLILNRSLIQPPETSGNGVQIIAGNVMGRYTIILPQAGANYSISVFNVLGQLIFSEKTSNRNYLLDLSHLSAGMYLIQTSQLNRTYFSTHKIIR